MFTAVSTQSLSIRSGTVYIQMKVICFSATNCAMTGILYIFLMQRLLCAVNKNLGHSSILHFIAVAAALLISAQNFESTGVLLNKCG